MVWFIGFIVVFIILGIIGSKADESNSSSSSNSYQPNYSNSNSSRSQASENISKALVSLGLELVKLNVKPHLIMQNGSVLWTSETLQERDRSYLDGRVFEVCISFPGESYPMFVYYENEIYYDLCVHGGSPWEFQDKLKCQTPDDYRTEVSVALAIHAALFIGILKEKVFDVQNCSFTHNRMHTNTIAWISRFNQWYPLQDTGTGEYLRYTIDDINSGRTDIRRYLAINEVSPS